MFVQSEFHSLLTSTTLVQYRDATFPARGLALRPLSILPVASRILGLGTSVPVTHRRDCATILHACSHPRSISPEDTQMLPPDRSRLRILVLVAACSWLSGWATAAESRFGQTYSPSGAMKEVVYGLLVSEPETRVIAPGKMRVRFRTTTPTPPAKLYYGINDITEKLDYPRYRLEVNEPGRFDEPRVYHQIEIPFDEVLKLMPNTPVRTANLLASRGLSAGQTFVADVRRTRLL